ncbi:hypothetical protein MYX76_17845, partial [Desulfobacterota bacterium AH_259_B03_O07]|nr:hypothetical protein [Desulfobacterota bacterium AH_259_B03_O07]
HYHPDNDKSILKVLFERMENSNKGQKHRFSLSRSRPYKKNDNAHEVNKFLQFLYDFKQTISRKKIMI